MQTVSAIALSAAIAVASSAALAHGPQGGFGGSGQQGYGPMMGQGYGQGHGPMMGRDHGPKKRYGYRGGMGRGYGHGMGPGYGGDAGQGFGSLMGSCPRGYGSGAPLADDLSAEGVRHMMEHRVERSGNPNLMVGEIVEKDDDTITADIVTKDGSLVRRFMVDRHTGMMRPEDMEQ
ncbi:MAG: hypothetical protein OEN23_15790 [Paracoccaceae bacterium]|nr:hypothetical protein [Paracoccaceae bacterium]